MHIPTLIYSYLVLKKKEEDLKKKEQELAEKEAQLQGKSCRTFGSSNHPSLAKYFTSPLLTSYQYSYHYLEWEARLLLRDGGKSSFPQNQDYAPGTADKQGQAQQQSSGDILGASVVTTTPVVPFVEDSFDSSIVASRVCVCVILCIYCDRVNITHQCLLMGPHSIFFYSW